MTGLIEILRAFLKYVTTTSSFGNFALGNAIMILVGFILLYLAVKKNYEPLLLVPIGFGIIVGNIPYEASMALGYQDVSSSGPSFLNIIYWGVKNGLYPPIIFLGIGAMTDFSALLSNPKLLLLGAAAQVGIFTTLFGAKLFGFTMAESGAIGIIGGADGPTAIFLSSKLAPHLLGAIAISAYSYMALVPVIQPPIMKLLTTKKERLIRMRPSRKVTKIEKILFPIIAFFVTCFVAPGAISLLGMLFFGNLLKECGVTERLASTARTSFNDIAVILIGFAVGASTQAQYFLTSQSLKIFALGAFSFAVATAGGIIFAKIMNVFLKPADKINPLVGAAGVSAVPDSARVAQAVGLKEDPTNHLLMHAMGPNVAGVIGSAIAAGILWSQLIK